LLPEPTYTAYRVLTQAARCTHTFISSNVSTTDIPQWGLDLEKIKRAATEKTRMLVFSNPCNPVGTITSQGLLQELATWCEQNKIYLIVDEVYDDYIFEGQASSVTPLVPSSEYVIRTGSFSKNFSMSGWRVGYMVVPEPLNVPLGRVQDAFLNCPSVLAQHAALYALNNPELVQQFHLIVKANRILAMSLLEPLVQQGHIVYQKPVAGFNIFIKVLTRDARTLCDTLLNEAHVAVVPGVAFGPSGNDFFRLCYARQPELIEEGIKRLVAHMSPDTEQPEPHPFTYAMR